MILLAVSASGHLRHERKRSHRSLLDEGIALGLFSKVEETGPWGPWSESSECSRTCGGGVAFQTRSCTVTSEHSSSCTGPKKRYFSCNIQDCPEGSNDFREEQCSKFDSIPFDGKFYKWTPYKKKKGLSDCELNCMPQGERFYYRHAQFVVDGTRCQDDATDVCVQGVCVAVGCDMMLGSEMKEDKCGECGGDGRNCKTVEGIFDLENLQVGYNDIILIPTGATNIRIEELEPTSNYIAVRNLTGYYYLNGNWRIEFPRHLRFAGTTFHYERSSRGHLGVETLEALGPTTEPVYVSLLYQQKNQGIFYEYSVPNGVSSTRSDSYIWITSSYGTCTKICAGGFQFRNVSCATAKSFEVVPEYLCDSSVRPSSNRSCNEHSCPARWQVTEWGECSQTCGGGTTYRQVHCHQLIKGTTTAVASDDECEKKDGTKPDFISSCNDHACPAWIVGPWSTCSKMCGEGEQIREVSCERKTERSSETVDHSLCDLSQKPQTSQPCSIRPCEGTEWIVSEWSGCDTVCGLTMESRLAFCASENGSIFPPNLCTGKDPPELTRLCTGSQSCDAMWHTSEWSECSSQCGVGVRTRYVFCGVRHHGKEVHEVSETRCSPSKKPDVSEKCDKGSCSGAWFTGPWTRCSVPCGGGYRSRKVMCVQNSLVAPDSHCDVTSQPFDREPCHMHPCDEDEIIMIGGCHKSKYGCCLDGVTPSGPNYEGCPTDKEELDCKKTEFGCCPDDITPAKGPFQKGCHRIVQCEETKYGCCPDGITPARGHDKEGCSKDCTDSLWGCCPDGQTTAKGINLEGCDLSFDCHLSKFGCCPDEITPASGNDYEGCEIDVSSGEDCQFSEFGCCPDDITPALGPHFKGCTNFSDSEEIHISDCSQSHYGCCPDGLTVASGPKFEGCENLEGSGEIENQCENTLFGCCHDGVTASRGPNYLGCDDSEEHTKTTNASKDDNIHEKVEVSACSKSLYGCCDDGITEAMGPHQKGCKKDDDVPPDTSCKDSQYGCCFDGFTPALGPEKQGCCSSSEFGCCPDNYTLAQGANNLGCSCKTFSYGCCPDEITPAKGRDFYGCTCKHSLHGCCQDGFTPSTGPNYEGCICHEMLYGCCPDGHTPAIGFDNQGCECSNLLYGCCKDNRTPAQGPNLEGCSCHTYPYGCCPDGRTVASGPHNQGCPCYAMPFGCCPDYKTAALGPSYGGCSCHTMPHGCCPDNETIATGPHLEGCPCNTMPHKCCPDGKTAARGSHFYGCPCTTFPYGCCPDGVTVAKDKYLSGCQDVTATHLDPVTGDVCHLPKERGPCHNYSVKWYFDMTYGGCSRFWFGGCDGNGNQFDTQEDCERVCVLPEGEDACFLPKVVGPCKGVYPAWYYNPNSDACESFTYSGCLGNNNRFTSKEQCERTCIHEGFQDPCEQYSDPGPCKKSYQRWYFSKSELACKPFIYGGCKGNDNNFATEKECIHKCAAFYKEEEDICHQPQEIGSCYHFRERWFFNANEERCQRFYYSGCGGNDNNFASLAECEKQCVKTGVEGTPDEQFIIEYCSLNSDSGSCSGKEAMWFYDKDGVCKQFIYGGCKGNGNRFHTKKECESKCGPSQDICLLPKIRGPCSGSFVQWYFDSNSNECFEFHYSGCQGNGNRFSDKDTCELQCKKGIKGIEITEHDICSEPRDTGPCLGYFLMWYYDSTAKTCKSFVYGGCKGNRNRFETLNDCLSKCLSSSTSTFNSRTGKDTYYYSVADKAPAPEAYTSNEDVCRQRKDEGQCQDNQNRWYYDTDSMACRPFIYKGCDGNKNRFKSSELCMRFCSGVQALPQDDSVEDTPSVQASRCPATNCGHLQCPYGMEKIGDIKGCISCLCSNPCEHHSCPEGSQCVVEGHGKDNGDPHWQPVCRMKIKKGRCPTQHQDNSASSEVCHDRCRTDADCPRNLKCCFVVCSYMCQSPNITENIEKTEEEESRKTDLPSAARILPTRKDVAVKVGTPALLRCIVKGSPFPEVQWYKNNQPLYSESGEYKISVDGSLHIISATLTDAGMYACRAHNGIGKSVTHFFNLIVYDEMRVNITLVTKTYQLGSPLQLDCVKSNSMPAEISWYLGENTLPLVSNNHRTILSNNTLYVASAQYNDSGTYICTAENEHTKATSSLSIQVYDIPIPPSCTDSPYFTSCAVIVKQQYCINPTYAKYCCLSCAISGQLQRIPASIS